MKNHYEEGKRFLVREASGQESDNGAVIYYDDGSQRWYVASASDIVMLGEYLTTHGRDAYSIWCADTVGIEIDGDPPLRA